MPNGTLEFEQEPEKTLEWNAQRLIYQRKASNLSSKQLAKIMGVQLPQITCMEQCTCIPSEEMLETLVSFFDVSGDYFGLEALDGSKNIKPEKLSLQDERQQAAKEKLKKQKLSLRKMMKVAGFPFSCTGLNSLATAIDEPLPDTCKYVNGELEMPVDAVQKTKTWFASVPKNTAAANN